MAVAKPENRSCKACFAEEVEQARPVRPNVVVAKLTLPKKSSKLDQYARTL